MQLPPAQGKRPKRSHDSVVVRGRASPDEALPFAEKRTPMFGRPYETIYLNFTSHPITVPLEVYEQVAALVQARRICQFCQSAYTKQNPMVAENCCLSCFVPHRDSPPKD